jgi:tetraacyldisaccharide 4'-kinase
VTALLKPAEWLYRGVNRMRRALYRRGILKAKRLPRPVISIGNLAVGGSGKTPAVIAVSRFLTERGYRVAVLTRGYGRRGDEQGIVEAPDAVRWGDEPILIKKSVPGIDVIVGVSRYDNAMRYLADNQCDVFVLDDGFQHLQLSRDLDIVIEAPDRAYLREGRSALRDADLVVPRSVRPSGLEALRGRNVFAFSGLADNEQFFDTLRREGINIAVSRAFPDHHSYTVADVEAIRREARRTGTDAIVTTEKDAVKIAGPGIVAVPIEFQLPDPVRQRILETVAR